VHQYETNPKVGSALIIDNADLVRFSVETPTIERLDSRITDRYPMIRVAHDFKRSREHRRTIQGVWIVREKAGNV